MPQPRRDAVHRYYVYDAVSKSSKCNLCGNDLKGKHTTNLKSHFSIKHPEEYEILTKINKENNRLQPSTCKEISNLDKVKNLCVRLVTTHGRPFALLQDAAFQEIINIAVPSNDKTKHINLNVIKGMIPEKAYQIKWKITNEIKNIMISLKLDSATYVDRNFLGINMQYIKNGKIVVRNLAVLEVLERQTADFLKEKLLEILSDFMISTSQIYSITTDNGSNFKKMTKLLTEYCCTSTTAQSENVMDITSENSDDENDDEDNTEEQTSASYAFNDLNIENFIDIMGSESFKPRVIFCAAHTLQLAVKDALNESLDAKMALQTARTAVKILRRPNMKNILRKYNLKKPIIDCQTRWTSTYQMLMRLNSLKNIVDDSELASIFSDNFWVEILNLIACLKPVYEATLALQREQLTISDFYIEWLNCKMKVEAINSSFAVQLAKAMKAREINLLNTDLVLENLYLDGRLNVVLSNEECEKAKSLIAQTFRQLENLRPSEIENREVADDAFTRGQDVTRTATLENYLQETEAMRALAESSSLSTFEGALSQLRCEPRLPLQTNILAHWANKGATNPSLMKVVNVVLAAPATQVSVERLFSSVKFILNPLRSNMSGSLLQNIMLIRSNHDLFE